MSVFGAGTAEDVAFVVCTAMHRASVAVVLSGGGAATIYAPEAKQTDDLDLVLPFMLSSPKLATIDDLGFYETGSRGVYAHPETSFTIEFLQGPLAVLDEVITNGTFAREATNGSISSRPRIVCAIVSRPRLPGRT